MALAPGSETVRVMFDEPSTSARAGGRRLSLVTEWQWGPVGPGETGLFGTAMAICAIAVIDDAFADPEPGTSAGDHLASGLVPVAAALVLAVAYPRLRPGLRAVIAIGCGVLALTAGVTDGFRAAPRRDLGRRPHRHAGGVCAELA